MNRWHEDQNLLGCTYFHSLRIGVRQGCWTTGAVALAFSGDADAESLAGVGVLDAVGTTNRIVYFRT